jgi:hypothetical protein
MSKATISLDNIGVASPCRVSWDDMIGTDQVRYCQKCNQRVYDLSGMSRAEAESLIRNKEGRLCVRFFRRPDGKVMTRDCPFGIRAMGRRLAWVLAIAAAFFVAIGTAFFTFRWQTPGQGQPGPSAWEFFRSFFAPAPPPPFIMGEVCPAGGPGGNPPPPQNPNGG